MASILLTNVGRKIGGSLFGKGLGASLGYNVGKIAGSFVDSLIFGSGNNSENNNGFSNEDLKELSIQTSTYGRIIPIIYGKYKISGNIIWVGEINDHKVFLKGKVGNKAILRKNSQAKFSINLAIMLAEGVINSIERIWANDALLDLRNYKITIYKGTEDQLPDPLMESFLGAGKVPAYRGLAYVVIEDFMLEEYGNNLPNFTFELVRKNIEKKSDNIKTMEEMINSVVIIPGSGEFVYDPKIQYQYSIEDNNDNNEVRSSQNTAINMNNDNYEADSVLSLKQLMDNLPNLQWVAPVVNWFGNDLDIKFCSIRPGVEHQQDNIKTTPDTWKVANFERKDAYNLLLSEKKYASYGGSINDESLIRYLEELKNKNLKIMFYPMFLMNDPGKSWRGRLTGNISEIENFFNKPDGYNNFILHYAKLAKPYIDAFIIGSELIGLTSITDMKGNFPAIDELVKLAEQVKKILGKNIKVTYAADWSEYHHTSNGWYHMDKLWSSKFIDFIGIDSYFPLTNLNHTASVAEIISGWSSGEGYNFYYENSDDRRNSKPLEPKYAWKNIEYWWENYHFNPNGKRTDWIPKSKKIWFTEYGFPSVDCATNQPNFFLDSESCESNLPHLSKGNIDMSAQRAGITATEIKWSDSEMIERKFLWCWDARPYPFWPDKHWVWRDTVNWKTGHWLNGKIGLITLNLIISEIASKAGLSDEDIDVTLMQIVVEGVIIERFSTGRNILEILQEAYFFDIVESDGKLKFLPRYNEIVNNIDKNDLIRNPDEISTNIIELYIKNPMEIPSKISVIFSDKNDDYKRNTEFALKEASNMKVGQILELPMLLEASHAKKIAEVNLYQRWNERFSYRFSLPKKYLYLEPADVIELEIDHKKYLMRIKQIDILKNSMLNIQAISDDLSLYYMNYPRRNNSYEKKKIYYETGLITQSIEMIIYFVEKEALCHLLIAILSNEKVTKLQNCFLRIQDKNYKFEGIIQISKFTTNGIGELHKNGNIKVILLNGELPEYNLYYAIFNNEIISFSEINNIGNNVYIIEKFSKFDAKIKLINENNFSQNFFLVDEYIIEKPLENNIPKSLKIEILINDQIACKKNIDI